MNLSAIQFPLVLVGVTLALLLLIDLLSGAPGLLYLAFLPAVVWAVVLALKASR